MPVAPHVTYPGVYIQEVPSDVRTVTPVETATAAFLGRALRGPVNAPVVIHSFADFQEVFGGLWRDNALGYAVKSFFLNGGGKAVIVRLFNKDKGPERATIKLDGGLELQAKHEGAWGNGLCARVTHIDDERIKSGVQERFRLSDAQAGDLFNLAVRDSATGKTEVFPNVTVVDGPRRIDKVIERAKASNLTLIVTDLFQNNADVNLLIKKLNDKFINKNLAIGILAVKSAFKGKVYCVGLKGHSFYYSTERLKPAKLRPFYIMMLGKYQDIRHLYENMEANGLDQIQEKKFLIISPSLVKRLSTFSGSTLTDISDIKEMNTIVGYGEAGPEVKQFYLRGYPESAYFQAAIPMDQLPHSVNLNLNDIRTETSIYHYESQQFQKCATDTIPLTMHNFSTTRSAIHFTTSIQPSLFPSKGIFCFKTTLRPGKKSLSLPKWVKQWDMNQNLISKWKKEPGKFDGSTTMNLKNFLNNILQIMQQKFNPKLATLYCYIRKS